MNASKSSKTSGPSYVGFPFVVVLLRLEMAVWTYYLWGALIILGGGVLYVIDTAASTRVDEAVEAAATARKAFEEAARGGVTPP